jgi:Domain of unknown function (DUF1922)
MQVICPACNKSSNTKQDLSGKSVRCSCGKSFVVAAASPPATGPAATVVSGQSIAVKCECGRSLRAPAASAGKTVKCPCGKPLKVPISSANATAASVPKASAAKAVAVAPVAASSNPFQALSDADWHNLAAQQAPPPVPQGPKQPSATSKALAQAVDDIGASRKAVRSGASGHLAQSRWILVGIGALKLAISVFYLVTISTATNELVAEIEEIRLFLQIFFGIGIAFSTLLILMGIFVFLMPMTCTISALVLFILLEIYGLILSPLSLVSIRGWAVRLAMGGALVQAINNAGYYKYVRSGG